MKKYISEFVKKQQALQKLAERKPRVLWDSQQQGTYVRKRHGELK